MWMCEKLDVFVWFMLLCKCVMCAFSHVYVDVRECACKHTSEIKLFVID